MKNLLILLIATFNLVAAQEIAVLKYNGGGDWYANPTALTNLASYCNEEIDTQLSTEIATVEASSVDIFQYPFVHMTGHGNVIFNEEDLENLKNYMLSGGFLHIDDNYGMRPYLEKELIKLFPDKELIELPANHEIFNNHASFPKGLPKIHEHDGERPQALGIFHEGRLVLLFTFEADLGDGWESPEVHNDPPEVRKKALDMGANIIKYVFTH
ncbi:DUF4159 domain-containing protein [Nonlabens sp.]|uniref:DUF4159 domain-containing protein n=1 Tax=Nonlabens sp. TaxID=1888209 RepID=UPI003F6A0B19